MGTAHHTNMALWQVVPAQMQGVVSLELLFWLPTLLDVLLLIVTYGSCMWYGVTWFLQTQTDAIAHQKLASRKKTEGPVTHNDDFKELKGAGGQADFDLSPELHAVWDLALAAYSGYASLLPLAVYWCVVFPVVRTSFCWAMTGLMLFKIQHLTKHSAISTSPHTAVMLSSNPSSFDLKPSSHCLLV